MFFRYPIPRQYSESKPPKTYRFPLPNALVQGGGVLSLRAAERWGYLLSLFFFLSLTPLHAQETTIDSRIANMTLEQKVAQLFVMSFYGTALSEADIALLNQWQVGAVVLLPSNIENPSQLTRLSNSIQNTLLQNNGIPAFIAVDQEGGIIAHLEEGFTRWPVPSLLTATQNPELAYQFGQALADEMLAVGINMNLAPVADLHTNRDNPIIGRRSFGSYPEQVAPIVAAVVEGMQANGVLATVKHFPGHGDTASDSHLGLPELTYNEFDLSSRELIPFAAAIDSQVGAVMVAHIYFPAIDESPIPASLSPNIITGILREDMAYDGIVITDAMDMDAIDTVYSPSESAIMALEAGNDFILLGAHISQAAQAQAMQALVDAVRSGQIPESRIDESLRRILSAKERFGLFNWQALEPNSAESRIDLISHQALVEQIFTEGITLSQDNSGLMPLSGNIAVIYPATHPRLWTECQHPNWSPLGVTLYPSPEEIAAASQAASRADTVLVFTENADENPQQQALVAAMPPEKTLVVALWSPYDLLSFPNVSSYMLTYSPLPELYRPLCAILKGEIPANGTLSIALDS
jgi:beta-N-acetylhexosaminidase